MPLFKMEAVKMDIDKLLTREQKEEIVLAQLREAGVRHEISLRYDRRYSWDWEVSGRGRRKTKVVFSVPLMSARFGFAITECAKAVREMYYGRTNAVAVRPKLSAPAIHLPGNVVMMRGNTEEVH